MPPGPAGQGAPGAPPKAPAAGAEGAGKLNFNIKLTKEQTNNLVAGVLITGVVIFGYVQYLIKPVMANHKKKTVLLEQKEKDLKDAREMVSKYAEFSQRASEIIRKVDFINKRLPKGANIADTIREMTKSATESNINIINFQPGKEVNKGDYKEYAIGVNYSTNYRNMGNFLTRIGYIERLTIPADLSVQKVVATGDSGNNLAVSMKLKIYSLAE